MNIVDFVYMSKTAILVAVMVIGVTQWFKNFTKTEKGRIYAVAAIMFTVIFCLLNTALVPELVTYVVDLIGLTIAITQLAWDVLAKAVPKAVGGFIDKLAGTKSGDKESNYDPHLH
jgi:uncharacterized membrane protein YczE